MPHGMSWLSFVPGYAAFEAGVGQLNAWLLGLLGLPAPHGHLVAQHVAAALLVIALMAAIGLSYRLGRPATGEPAIPDERVSLRNAIEAVLEALYGLVRDALGPQLARAHFPVLASLGMFILLSNLLGLVPGFTPPTENLMTTAACGLFVFGYYNALGIAAQGPWRYFAHLANPAGTWWGWLMMPLMLPIELVGHLARPLSLSIRLMANVTADHRMVAIMSSLVAPLVPLPFQALGCIVAVVQAMVFVLLATSYIKIATEASEEAH